MVVKRFVVTLNMLRDKRVPPKLRRQAFRLGDGSSGTMGAISLNRRVVYVDAGSVMRASRYFRRRPTDFLDVLLCVIDHEYGHAFAPHGYALCLEERMILAFERAGAWSRGDEEMGGL